MLKQKSGPIFPRVAQNCSLRSFYLKEHFQIAQKVTKYLSYFCKYICCQDFSKIAQSGRTAARSFLVEGDEQLDRPKSQTSTYEMLPCMCCILFGWLLQTQQLTTWADNSFISFY